jgi:hypothetical protein
VVSTTLRPLYPRKRPGTHYTGGWVGPRAGLDVCEKFRPCLDLINRNSMDEAMMTQRSSLRFKLQGFDPRTVQPEVSRYTD